MPKLSLHSFIVAPVVVASAFKSKLSFSHIGALVSAVTENGDKVEGDVKASGSYLLTGDYYFNTNKFRPFAGFGAGLYRLAAVSFDTDMEEGEIGVDSKFGFAPRAGFEYGHFRTALEYNFAGKTGSINNNYIGIKMGFFIGGGRLSN